MPVLVAPTPSVHLSYLDAQAEFHAEGRNLEIDRPALANPNRFVRHIAEQDLIPQDTKAIDVMVWRGRVTAALLARHVHGAVAAVRQANMSGGAD